MSIFDKRVKLKPYEYPDVMGYVDAINHSFWTANHIDFTSDIQDFHVKLNDVERSAIKNTLLAISQIEVAVKMFWANLGQHLPKPELASAGLTCGESEVRHQRLYSKLLEVLGLDTDFEVLFENEAMQGRIKYLDKALKNASSKDNKAYTLTLALFTIFTENVSLFSQFAIIKCFWKNRTTLKNIDNAVQLTLQEELCHAQLGFYLINHIRKEYPEWFDDTFFDKVYEMSKKAYAAECNIIDWIFEKGELSFVSKDTLKKFIAKRINDSLESINAKPIFEVNQDNLQELKWFDDEIYLHLSTDFFNKRPNSYSIKMQSITEEDLF